ncbi:MAG: DHH family phosphoesterase [Patescibacteria group bacterium]|nr:DHH family phosphoesterase [Patescibacteria group bacterium]
MNLSEKYVQLFELLKDCNSLLLAAHQKPDGDALGSSTALGHWLLAQGKNVTFFCKDKPAKSYSYLNHYLDFTDDPKVFDEKYDVLIVLDSGTLNYCGIDQSVGRLSPGCKVINFDHHKTNDGFGDLQLVDATASSTSEMVAMFLKTNSQPVDSAIATSLMTGIMFDTSYFSNAATQGQSFSVVGDLLAAGARTSDIAQVLLKNKEAGKLKLWGIALSRLKYNSKYDLAFTYIKQEDFVLAEAGQNATEGMINFLNGVCGDAEIIMLLTQKDDNTIKGSFRSIKTDVSKIAKALGGGGHKNAPGFTIQGKIVETEKGVRVV